MAMGFEVFGKRICANRFCAGGCSTGIGVVKKQYQWSVDKIRIDERACRRLYYDGYRLPNINDGAGGNTDLRTPDIHDVGGLLPWTNYQGCTERAL